MGKESFAEEIEDLIADEPIDPVYFDEENERILTMVTAMYVKTLYPKLTVLEVFEKMQDVEFIKEVINHIREDITAKRSTEDRRKMAALQYSKNSKNSKNSKEENSGHTS